MCNIMFSVSLFCSENADFLFLSLLMFQADMNHSYTESVVCFYGLYSQYCPEKNDWKWSWLWCFPWLSLNSFPPIHVVRYLVQAVLYFSFSFIWECTMIFIRYSLELEYTTFSNNKLYLIYGCAICTTKY